MEVVISSMIATFMIGLSFGAGACMFTCIPTLGVMLLSQQLTPKETALQTWRFNAGRLSAYALLATGSGLIGASLVGLLEAGQANVIFAVMMLFSALILWRKGKQGLCSNGHSGGQQKYLRAGLFGMGFSMGLRPCVPLAAVMTAAATTGSAVTGMLLGLSFGLGAIIVPQLLFGFGLGHAGQEIRSQLRGNQQTFARVGATMIASVGIGVGMGWVAL